MSKGWIPDAGDLIYLNFDPQTGREQAGARPALVISAATYNEKSSLALVCPVTSKVKNYPFEVPLPDGFKVTGVVLADQLKSLDWRARKASFLASSPRPVLDTVRKYLALLLGTH